MAESWNLTAREWSTVLLDGAKPETVAKWLIEGELLPWTNVLLKYTADSRTVLDLGSGRGDHSAVLALNGRETTLLDWSQQNLDFSARLFNVMDIRGQFCLGDATKPLPFKGNSFDTVFSCGVFEYFTRRTIKAILSEAFRVASKRVIIMVPNAFSVAYRVGKWYMEKTGRWPWGGEVPSYTLKHYFRAFGNVRTIEFSIDAKHSLSFLTMPMGEPIKRVCTRFLKFRDQSKPALFRQGYLLVTVGEKI